jgi:hypothetical protein
LTDFFLSLLTQVAEVHDVTLENDLIRGLLHAHFTSHAAEKKDVKGGKEGKEEEEDEFFGCGEVIDDKAVCERAASEAFNSLLFNSLSSWRESFSENLGTGMGTGVEVGGGAGDAIGSNALEKNGNKFHVKSSSSSPEGDSAQNSIESSLAVTSIFVRAWLNGSYLHSCSLSSSSANVSSTLYYLRYLSFLFFSFLFFYINFIPFGFLISLFPPPFFILIIFYVFVFTTHRIKVLVPLRILYLRFHGK